MREAALAFSNIDPSAKMLSYSGIFQRVPANSPASTLKSLPQATGHFRQVVSRSQYRSLKRSPLTSSSLGLSEYLHVEILGPQRTHRIDWIDQHSGAKGAEGLGTGEHTAVGGLIEAAQGRLVGKGHLTVAMDDDGLHTFRAQH